MLLAPYPNAIASKAIKGDKSFALIENDFGKGRARCEPLLKGEVKEIRESNGKRGTKKVNDRQPFGKRQGLRGENLSGFV